MAQKVSNIRKRELRKPDEFITLSNKIALFSIKHKKILLTILLAFVLIFLSFQIFSYISISKERKALSAKNAMMLKYTKVIKEGRLENIYNDMKKDMNEFLEEYKNTEAAKTSALNFANVAYENNDLSLALKLYKDSLKNFRKNKKIISIINKNIAFAYMQKGDLDSAASFFEKNLTENFIKDEDLFNLALIYQKKGKKEKALEYYKKNNK